MIISNLFQGPVLPKTIIGAKWKVSTTYTDIHSKTGKEYVWVHSPPDQSWICFCLDGSSIEESKISQELKVDILIKEVETSSLHNYQLSNAFLKALVFQTVGMNNFNESIYPTDNLNYFDEIQITLKFFILTKNEEKHIFLRIDTRNKHRKLDVAEGLLSTEERFMEIQKIVNHYWSKGIFFIFGNQRLDFQSEFCEIGD